MNTISTVFALLGISAFLLFLHSQYREVEGSASICQRELQQIEVLEAEIRGLKDGAALSN